MFNLLQHVYIGVWLSKQKKNKLPYSDLTSFLCIVFKRDLNAMVLLVLKAESVEQMVHLFGHIWAKHVKRISRVIGHGWESLVIK